MKYLADQVRIKLISQLFNDISRVFQKLLIILMVPSLTSFLALFPILTAIFVLDLNEALLLLSTGKSAKAPLASENG